MRRALLMLALIASAHAAAARYSGTAGLAAPVTAHSGRYAVTAELRPARAAAAGRYTLRAQLAHKSTTATCGPLTPTIFANGFE